MWRFFDRCDAAAKEISTAIMDALFIKAGLFDEPTTETVRQACAHARKDRRQIESGNDTVSQLKRYAGALGHRPRTRRTG